MSKKSKEIIPETVLENKELIGTLERMTAREILENIAAPLDPNVNARAVIKMEDELMNIMLGKQRQ